jgi:hypothetical protein
MSPSFCWGDRYFTQAAIALKSLNLDQANSKQSTKPDLNGSLPHGSTIPRKRKR